MSTESDQEDWIKGGSWDLPNDFQGLLNVMGLLGCSLQEQQDGIKHLMTLPAWKPAPAAIRTAAIQFIAKR